MPVKQSEDRSSASTASPFWPSLRTVYLAARALPSRTLSPLLLRILLSTALPTVLLTAPATRAVAQTSFSIRSAEFSPGGTVRDSQMYAHAGCHGQNISPSISWSNPPAGTKSFAVTLHDPDAPGRGWWHWAVANIPASIHQLPTNASASGALAAMGAIEARNDFDDNGYSGPCPPASTVHRYVLTVYALNSPNLRVSAGRPAPFFEHEIANSTLAKASLIVRNRPHP